MSGEKIWLFDTTLRDGGQTRGVDFSRADKLAIAHTLDDIGIDYVEGGWPGANPTDDAFFANPPKLKTAKLFAFGMTRRGGRSAANDPGLNAVIDAEVDGACLVGKTWDFHVKTALNTTLDENLIDSCQYSKLLIIENESFTIFIKIFKVRVLALLHQIFQFLKLCMQLILGDFYHQLISQSLMYSIPENYFASLLSFYQ